MGDLAAPSGKSAYIAVKSIVILLTSRGMHAVEDGWMDGWRV